MQVDPDELAKTYPDDTLRRTKYPAVEEVQEDGSVLYVCSALMTHANGYVVVDVSYQSAVLDRSKSLVDRLASLAAQRLAKAPTS